MTGSRVNKNNPLYNTYNREQSAINNNLQQAQTIAPINARACPEYSTGTHLPAV